MIKEDGDDKLSSTDLRRRQLGEHQDVKVIKLLVSINIMDVVGSSRNVWSMIRRVAPSLLASLEELPVGRAPSARD